MPCAPPLLGLPALVALPAPEPPAAVAGAIGDTQALANLAEPVDDVAIQMTQAQEYTELKKSMS